MNRLKRKQSFKFQNRVDSSVSFLIFEIHEGNEYGQAGLAVTYPTHLLVTASCLYKSIQTSSATLLYFQVCPICAAIPAGEPNHVTDDFATHLAIEHNNSQRANAEDPMLARQNMRSKY